MASSPPERPSTRPSPERFAEIVSPLQDPMIALARRILRSDDLAKDAVQEALLTLWCEAELPPNPHAWLVRAVVHRSLHLSRSRLRRRRHEGLACFGRPEASDCDDPTRGVESEEAVGKMREAFAELAPEFREVLVLRAVEELDYEAIAQVLAIPIGTVRSRLNRSRKAFREILRRILPDGDGVVAGEEEAV
jgi:RNA polymerase sigma-70 factor (ECF subfamily)